MKKIILTTVALFLTLLLNAQAQKGTKPKNNEIKEPILTTIPVEAKSNPVIRPEDEIKEILKQLNALKIEGDGLVLQGVTENGNLMYVETGGRKIGLNPTTGEMEVLAATAKCKFPIKLPPNGPGPYNPYPKGPYMLIGILPDGQLVNSASDGTNITINTKNGVVSKTIDKPRGGCVLRPKPVTQN